MAEPLILINGRIDQLSSVLPHVTKPTGIPADSLPKRALSSWLGVKSKGSTLQPVLCKSTGIRSSAVNWGKVGYLGSLEHFVLICIEFQGSAV